MNSALEILRRERDAFAEQAKALRVRIKELDAAIALLGERSSAPKVVQKGDADLNTLVTDILTGAGTVGLVAKDITVALGKMGRETTDASVSSVLSRLKGKSKVRNDSSGRWFAVSEEPENSEDADDLMDDDPFGAPSPASHSGVPFDDLDEEIPF